MILTESHVTEQVCQKLSMFVVFYPAFHDNLNKFLRQVNENFQCRKTGTFNYPVISTLIDQTLCVINVIQKFVPEVYGLSGYYIDLLIRERTTSYSSKLTGP